MLSAGPLPIVESTDDGMATLFRRLFPSFVIRLVDDFKTEFAYFRQVASVRQHTRTPGQYFICGNIVSHLQQDRDLHMLWKFFHFWNRSDVRPFMQLHFFRLFIW